MSISVTATVGGKSIPVEKFNVTGGSYGSVGHAEITTSIKALQAAGINLTGLASSQPSNLVVQLSATTNSTPSVTQGNPISSLLTSAMPNSPVASAGTPSPASSTSSGSGLSGQQQSKANAGTPNIFGGEYMSAEFHYDRDECVIKARDYAGILVDQKRVLTTLVAAVKVLAPGQVAGASVSTMNQTISQIVGGIAKQFGLKFVPHLQAGNDPTVGAVYGSDDFTVMTMPQSLWGILNKFALYTGYEVYVTPKKELVFGVAGAGLTPLKLSYNTPTVQTGAVPCKNLRVTHNPRRNSSFRVLVLSYDPGKGQQTTGRATAIGTNLSGTGSQQVQAGVWTGSNAATIDSTLSGSGAQMQLYTFHIDGLTQAQAQAQAVAIANDIYKREFVLEATIDGYPSVSPGQKVNISGTVDPAFSGANYYVSAFYHSFSMPEKTGIGEKGFHTTLKCLNIPLAGNGNPVKPKAATAPKLSS